VECGYVKLNSPWCSVVYDQRLYREIFFCVFSSHFCSPNFHGFLVCGQLWYLLEWCLSNYFLPNHMIMQKTTVMTHHEIRSFKALLTTVCCNFFIGYRLVSYFDHFILRFFNTILATHLLWHSTKKEKGEVTPLQARLWPRGGGRDIALLFPDLGTRRG